MRAVFTSDLNRLDGLIAEMSDLVHAAVDRAVRRLAGQQGDGDGARLEERINAHEEEIGELALALLVRQQPVAMDLRVVVTALAMATTLERMGDLADHVARIAARRGAALAAHPCAGLITQMGDLAVRAAARTARLMRERDLALAAEIEDGDDALDDLHRRVYHSITAPEPALPPADVVDAALLARFLERLGDHAVSLAHRTAYLVTGDLDRSALHPEADE